MATGRCKDLREVRSKTAQWLGSLLALTILLLTTNACSGGGAPGGRETASERERVALDGSAPTSVLEDPEAPAVDGSGQPITAPDGRQLTRNEVITSGGTLPPSSPQTTPTTRRPATTTTTTTTVPRNRAEVTSYYRGDPDIPWSNPTTNITQSFVARSNTLTQGAVIVGFVDGADRLTIRLSSSRDNGCQNGELAEGTAVATNFSFTVVDFGDVPVTPGGIYYLCWTLPRWGIIAYYGPGGDPNLVSTTDPIAHPKYLNSNQFAGFVRGYNR